MALFWCVLVSACAAVVGFNVDIASRVVHRGVPDSMFGFTVQSHIDGGDRMILVGAPEADTRRLPGVERPGAVYRCNPSVANQCREMIFDKLGNNVDMRQRQIDEKSNQWFGATLSSTGHNGPIVACAPRYVSYVSSSADHRDPVGACFLVKSSRSEEGMEFSPCRTQIPSRLVRRTGVCQAGFSAAISKNGDRLIMGAPGSFYWQGRTLSIDPTQKFFYFMPNLQEGQLISQGSQTPALISTIEQHAIYDDSYKGYSVAVGNFAPDRSQGIAAGVPRGAELRGMVLLYSWDLKVIKTINGSQIGAYFGYCVAAGDIDGNGYDDLIVGAPMFTRAKTEGYEHGRVYVIYQDDYSIFSRSHARTGEVSKGRFGLSVTSLGDINRDGYGDFAVGAPYGGKHGRGMVYIYHGSFKGASDKYSQAIAAEEVDPGISTFGFSLSGGVDLDNNNYTDLAVGAYESNSVVFFRSRPVVNVKAQFNFMGNSKVIVPDDKRCTLRNGTTVACAQLYFCLSYSGINVDQQINFEVTLELDSKQKNTKRLFLIEGGRTTYKENLLLTYGVKQCRNVTVYLDEAIRDKLTPLEVALSYDMITHRTAGVIPPVLDQTINNVYTDSLHIQKNCGPDNVCIPDLQMAVITPNYNYILGSNENVNITVSISNPGEDAFEAAYYLTLPPGVTYASIKRYDEETSEEATVYCSVSNRYSNENQTLKCELGNPLTRGQKLKFDVILEVETAVRSLEFDMEVNSTNPEKDTIYDNKRHLQIGVLVKAQLTIIGTSDPPELYYNASNYDTESIKEDSKLGPQVVHKYNIKNDGPFPVQEAELYIMWPYETLNGDSLMYMLIQPQVVGPLKCDVARNINPEAMFVKNPYNDYLQKELEAYESSEFGTGKSVYGKYNAEHRRGNFNKNNDGINRHESRYNERHYAEENNNEGVSNSEDNLNAGSQNGIYTQEHKSESHGSHKQYGNSDEKYGQNEGSYRHNQGSYGQNQGSYGQNQGSYSQNQGSSGQVQRNYGQSEGSYANSESRFGHGQSNQNSGSFGQGRAGQGQDGIIQTNGIRRQWNKTILYDEHGNVISETETSTQYGTLGREGEQGSSFSNRYGGSGVYHQGAFNQNHSGQGRWDQRNTWSTEETINKDIMNAASNSHGSNADIGSSVSVVGDEDDEIGGFAANAAYNPNNQFRVGYADLGVAGSSGGGSQSSQSAGSIGGKAYTGRAQSGESGGSSYSRSGSNTGGGYSYSSSSGSSNSGSGQYSYSGSSRSHGGYNDAQGHHDLIRTRRQGEVDPELKEMLEKCNEKYKCEVVRCVTGVMLKGQEVWVALRSRINASVLNEITKDRPVKLSTLAATRVTKLPIVDKPKESKWKTAEAQTVITPQLEALSSGAIPLWVVVLAAVLGALLLLLLIFVLYKCGFFKRNRPTDHAERQPLNGRDEHL